MDHTCELVYRIGGNNIKYGAQKGFCRITGKESIGISFNEWVKDTFTDHASLFPGTIISNEALFCFDECSDIVMVQSGKEKPQRFRTYSHIVCGNKWYCLTKADKEKIFNLICSGAEMVCLTDSGQKHILFKHKPGMWQLDEIYLIPDIEKLKRIHLNMCFLLKLGFSQKEVISGQYPTYKLLKIGYKEMKCYEDEIKNERGTAFFEFASWMLFNETNNQ